jgi:tRNA A-37 threonylcarbamoyl transferase component Bud32
VTRTLAGYRLGRRIAVGGMAEIFEATAPKGERVVVKILLPQYARDPELVRLLEHEGRLMQRIAHPRLVRVIDVHAAGEEPFLVLEHIDGAAADEVLDRMKNRGERPSPEMALALVLPLVEALAHVHAAKDEAGKTLDVVHRDVTPHNVLIERSGDVRLGDFGIARSSLRDARTRTGIIRGKLRYLAPEQATGSTVDAKTDLYGLGLILFEVLTLEPYLPAENEVELLRAAESPTFKKPSSIDGVDPRFDRLLERLLARFPEERPRNAAAVHKELARIAEGMDLAAARAAWGREVSAIAGTSARVEEVKPARSPWPIFAIALVAIVGLVVVSYALFGGGDGERPLNVRSEPRPMAIDAGAIEERARSIDAGPQQIALAAIDAGVQPARPSVRERPRPIEEPPPPIVPAAPDLEPLRARARALRADLRSRGIADGDLSPAQRAELAAIDAAIARADGADALRRIDTLAPLLASITIDETFVRAKMERVDARVRAARSRGMSTDEIDHLSALALQDLVEGRTEATNRRLNQILALLDRAR